MTSSSIRIALVTIFFNAGETTRGVELSSALRTLAQQQGIHLDIQFFSSCYSVDNNFGYEHFVTDAGFSVNHVGRGLSKDEWNTLLEREHAGQQHYNADEKDRVVDDLTRMKEAVADYQPTIVLHGFSYNFDGAVVAKMLGIPNVLFLPLPLTEDFIRNHVVTDFPDEALKGGMNYVPKALRARFIHWLASIPFLPLSGANPTVRAAALECGWKLQGKGMIVDMLAADLMIVNDLPGNYKGMSLPGNTYVSGPVFPHNNNDTLDLDPEILRVFDAKNSNKVFVAMGSSGHQEQIVEAIKAVNRSDYHVVVLVPPSMASIEEVKAEIDQDLSPNVYLTDKFLPAKAVNKLADVAIIHGGQGTVQTAMIAGTPVIGVPFQPEQRWNVECVVNRGAGIQLSPLEFTEHAVVEALNRLLADPAYKAAAQAVQKEMEVVDGAANSATKILEFVEQLQCNKNS